MFQQSCRSWVGTEFVSAQGAFLWYWHHLNTVWLQEVEQAALGGSVAEMVHKCVPLQYQQGYSAELVQSSWSCVSTGQYVRFSVTFFSHWVFALLLSVVKWNWPSRIFSSECFCDFVMWWVITAQTPADLQSDLRLVSNRNYERRQMMLLLCVISF